MTGRSEIWAALETAITLMQAGDLDTAQGIVDAAGVTVPTGDFCQGCYDQQGVLYRLPQCIVSDPENMVPESNHDDELFDTDDGKLSLDEASGDELMAEDVERRRDEKGKTSERDLVRVKARLSDRDGPDLVVSVREAQSVGHLARRIQQDAAVCLLFLFLALYFSSTEPVGLTRHVQIPRTQRVRIAYLGRMLKEHAPLVDQGWKPGNVVNALVVTRH